ncbi:MAG TPA: response regulator transcription factor [Chitinispirillaceae bacterium]|nr:response regulator transcription factor [Chitinispirillaceae bacterium]
MKKKRIIIVEDHEEMQFLYSIMFRKEHDIEIAAQVTDADEALRRLEELNPDLVLIDISLPGKSGIDFTKIVRKSHPGLKILIVTGYEPNRFYDIAKKAGADDLIMKSDIRQIIKAVRRLLGIE